jgi:hypothetical protein
MSVDELDAKLPTTSPAWQSTASMTVCDHECAIECEDDALEMWLHRQTKSRKLQLRFSREERVTKLVLQRFDCIC